LSKFGRLDLVERPDHGVDERRWLVQVHGVARRWNDDHGLGRGQERLRAFGYGGVLRIQGTHDQGHRGWQVR
jgi:hypothetical protein